MAMVFVIDGKMTREQYDAAFPELDLPRNLAPGDLVHLAWELPDGGMRVVDVWESEESFSAFVRERLGPVMQKHGIPQPTIATFPLHNGYTSAGALR
jgi:hypothetical protein